MAIYVKCNNPQALLDKIKRSVDNGNVESWRYDDDGDFFHTPNGWPHSGWLRPYVENGDLIFGIVGPKDDTMTTRRYAAFHSYFLETLLNLFDGDFDWAYVSSQKRKYDLF